MKYFSFPKKKLIVYDFYRFGNLAALIALLFQSSVKHGRRILFGPAQHAIHTQKQ